MLAANERPAAPNFPRMDIDDAQRRYSSDQKTTPGSPKWNGKEKNESERKKQDSSIDWLFALDFDKNSQQSDSAHFQYLLADRTN